MNRRIAGIVGLTGAIVLLIGDALLYGHLGSATDFWNTIPRVAGEASLVRLFAGGLLGPVGAVLYLAGFWHVYLNTRTAGRITASITLIGLSTMIVGGGAYHIIWVARMLAYKYGLADIAGSSPFVDAFESYMTMVYYTAAIPGFLASPMLGFLVLSGRSRYPRWTVLVNPGLLMLFGLLLGTSFFPAPVGGMIYGGIINLTFCLFFVVSIVTTWKEESDVRQV
jgi:hypothetical protein